MAPHWGRVGPLTDGRILIAGHASFKIATKWRDGDCGERPGELLARGARGAGRFFCAAVGEQGLVHRYGEGYVEAQHRRLALEAVKSGKPDGPGLDPLFPGRAL